MPGHDIASTALGHAPVPAHPHLRAVPDEPDQVSRLGRFCRDHPEVIITPDQFRTWRAIIPEASGETVIVRHTLRELLGKLDGLLGGPS